MRCVKVEELHECGHTTTIAYSNCGNHGNSDAQNEACHRDTPTGKNGYVRVRRGSSECFFPCKVARVGWRCCECSYRKKHGSVCWESDMPEHEITHRNGLVEYHRFCNRCKIVDPGLTSGSDLTIYSGASTVVSGDFSINRHASAGLSADSYTYVDDISNLSQMIPEALNVPSRKVKNPHEHRDTSSSSRTRPNEDMYDSLMSGKELVLDLHSDSDRRMFKDLLSMVNVSESATSNRRMNVGALRSRS